MKHMSVYLMNAKLMRFKIQPVHDGLSTPGLPQKMNQLKGQKLMKVVQNGASV
jgi:hypothetical protein